MTTDEFSKEFDIRFNFINSNLAYSVNDYEKSVYLTRGQEELLDNYFNPKGNKYGEGFGDSSKRNIDFSALITVYSASVDAGISTIFSGNGVFTINDDVFKILNEKVDAYPIKYLDLEDLDVIAQKPYIQPPKRLVWAIPRSNNSSGRYSIEVILHDSDTIGSMTYKSRYLKRPSPIVVANLPGGFTVNGVATKTECILPPDIHDEILNRAIEICRIDYLGDTGGMIELNKRNE